MLSSPAAQPLFIECPSCSGTGTQTEYRGPWSRDYRCEDCNGTGVSRCETRRCGEEAVRVIADMRCCAACAVLADADIAAYEATLCKAGQDHDYLRHHATEQEWAALEYVGQQSDDGAWSVDASALANVTHIDSKPSGESSSRGCTGANKPILPPLLKEPDMAALIARDRQPLPVIRTASAPEIDTDEVSAILAVLDTALAAHKLRRMMPAGAVVSDVALMTDVLPHAEYAVTLWASAQQLQISDIVNEYESKTMRVLRVLDGDEAIVSLLWPSQPKVTGAAVLGALRGWRPTDHWTDESTTSLDSANNEVITKEAP